MEHYTLRAGKTSARIQAKGAEIVSFIPKDGAERIWQGNPQVWAGHAPLLFPIVGSLKDGQTVIEGKTYAMQKHGLVREETFALGLHGEDFVEWRLESTPEMHKQYPFAFTLHVIYTLWEDRFSCTYIVENRSGRPMPFCIGGHPAFNCPVWPGERFEDYALVFDRKEDGENSLAPRGYIVTGREILPQLAGGNTLPLDHAVFDQKDALILTHLASRRVRLLHRESGRGIQFDFPKFDVLGVWTMPGKKGGYLCLEPWSGIPDEAEGSGQFTDKRFIKWAEAGQCYRTGFSAEMI